MRRIMAVLMAVFLLSVPQVTAQAEESTISAKVPDEHKIEINAEHAEAVYQNKKSLAEAEDDEKIYMVPRFSEPEFKLTAKDGYQITKVLLGDEDITAQIRDGLITLPEVYEDQVLTIETEERKKDDTKVPDDTKNPAGTGNADRKRNQAGTGNRNSGNNGPGNQNSGKGGKGSGGGQKITKRIKAAVTGDVAKCGVTTCVLLAAAGVAVVILRKKEL